MEPHSITKGKELEQLQKSAARFVHSGYRRTTSSSAHVTALGWDLLHTRRLLAQCSLFYKLHHKLVNLPLPPTVILANNHGRHDHNLKYIIPQATTDVFKYSFYPRTIRIWNSLPGPVVNATGLMTFQKAALPVIRTVQPAVGSSIV